MLYIEGNLWLLGNPQISEQQETNDGLNLLHAFYLHRFPFFYLDILSDSWQTNRHKQWYRISNNEFHAEMSLREELPSLEPRLSVPDFVSRLWRKIRNWEPGFEAIGVTRHTINEWALLRSRAYCGWSALGFSFRVRAQTQMKIWYIKGI